MKGPETDQREKRLSSHVISVEVSNICVVPCRLHTDQKIGRKLRCDGTRPSCWNCKSRDDQICVYQNHPRRRGPGKAPKGSRKKKSEVGTSASNDGSQRYSTSEDDFDLPMQRQPQTQLPPMFPHPPTLPQGGLIMPSSRMHDLAFSQEQDRLQQRYARRGTRNPEDEDAEDSVHSAHHHSHPDDPF